MTFAEYIKANFAAGITDLQLRANVLPDGSVEFYIHPYHRDGLTMNFQVLGSHVLPDPHRAPHENDIRRLLQAAAQGQTL